MFLSNRASLTTSLGATPPPASFPTLVPATCVANTITTVLVEFNNGPTLVKLGTINNASEGSTTANANKTYYDYSLTACTNPKFSTSIANTTNPQTITLSCQTNTNIFNVYIDYNNDGAFNETTEKVVADLSIAPNAQANAAFTFPLSGVMYNTALRMRVVAGNATYTSCANNIARGQVEDYMVKITNSVLAVDITGIKSNRNSIFPNPANEGIFNIKFGDASVKSAHIAIVDMAGRVVYQTSGTTKNGVLKINSKLSAGNYIVKMTTENSTATEKLIIQ